MGDVVSMAGSPVTTETFGPNAEVIALLKNFLAQAERGEIQAVGIIGARHNGSTCVGYELPVFPVPGLYHHLQAASSMLTYRLLQGADSTF